MLDAGRLPGRVDYRLMNPWLLLALLVLGATAALAALVAGIVFAVKRRGRRVLACAGILAAGVLLAAVAAGALVLKGARYTWQHTVVPARKSMAEREARWQASLSARRALMDPAVLPTVPADFFTYDGFRDWWRVPLVYPYGAEVIDTMDNAAVLQRHKGGPIPDPNVSQEDVLRDVIGLAFDRQFILIHQGPSRLYPAVPEKWILLEIATGRRTESTSEAELLGEAQHRGYGGPPKLATFRETYEAYFVR
jgi:hypothetical protein